VNAQQGRLCPQVMSSDTSGPSVQMINLGCAKNVVDSEEMLGVLAQSGFSLNAGSERADVVVINTCGFIEAARQESIDVILEALERKRSGKVGKVVVAGCLAQRYASELPKELPEVDAFVGTGQAAGIGRIVRETLTGPGRLLQVPQKPHHRWLDVPTRIRSTAPWTAYLKISEGCNHRCAFCAIPSFRGPHVSKPLKRILDEAATLAEQGVRELNLIAQDSTQYGYDLCGKPMLPALLRELSQVDGIRWLRLFYCYPSRVNAAVIEAIATTPKVCRYIDMPLQHADDEVLRAMRRPGTGRGYLRLLERFRAASPDVAIRTTFIVGHPGETEEQFENLLRFVEAAQFDRVGVFEYSVEEGTPSAALAGRVPARVKRARRDRLMRLQQEISLARNRRWIDREMEVLVEEMRKRGNEEIGDNTAFPHFLISPSPHFHLAVGRSFRDAPEIDGQVYLTGTNAMPGAFITARITAARTYDLIASTEVR
jgi:ribosomal protein S12 methylthiotransferase